MNTGKNERLPDDPENPSDQEASEPESDFEGDDVEVSEELEEAFEGDLDGAGGVDEEIEAVVALSAKEQSARSLEIRRAIEERREKRQLEDDIDYLDMDLDD